MDSKRQTLFASWRTMIFGVAHRFPQAIFFAFLTCGLMITLHHISETLDMNRQEWESVFARLTMISVIGFFFGVIFTFLKERIEVFRKIGVAFSTWLGIGLIQVSFFLWLLEPFQFEQVTRYIGIILSLFLLCFAVPFLFKKAGIVQFAMNVLIRLALTYIFSMVIMLGIFAIIVTIDFLFGTKIMDQFGPDIPIIIGTIFAPIFLLNGIPKNSELEYHENPQSNMPDRIFLFYILMPLTSVYALVLSVYAIMIMVTQNWPNGIVGNMVLWFSIICCVIFYFSHPKRASNPWVALYLKVMPKWILPLLLMLFVAVWLRIDSYGMTENRYFLVAAALWATVICCYYAFSRVIHAALVPFLLVVTVIVSISGPWSSYAVALRSQTDILESVLAKHNLILDGKMIPAKNIDFTEDEKQKIRGVMDYIVSNQNASKVDFLPQEFDQNDPMISEDTFQRWFGFEKHPYNAIGPDDSEYFTHNIDPIPLLKIDGFSYILTFKSYDPDQTYQVEDLTYVYSAEKKIITIYPTKSPEQIMETIDVAKIAAEIHRNIPADTMSTHQKMIYDYTKGKSQMRFVFQFIDGNSNRNSSDITINVADFWLFVKTK